MINAHKEKDPKKTKDFPLTELTADELFQAAESYLKTPSQVEVYCLCFSTAKKLSEELERFEEDCKTVTYPDTSEKNTD